FEKSRVPNTTPSLALARYAGTYVDSMYPAATISFANGTLRLKFGRSLSGRLEHWNYDTFIATWDDKRLDRSLVTFAVDARGEPSTLRLDLEGPMVLARARPSAATRAGER